MNTTISMPEFEGFDWTGGNAKKNWLCHQVHPWESEQVFFNSPILIQEDKKHSIDEQRYFVLGKTDAGRELFIVFTIRENRIRVVSSRDMSVKERRIYRAL